MSINPYESPQWTDRPPVPVAEGKVRRVATYQRYVIVAVTANTVVNLLSWFTPTTLPLWIWIIGLMALAAVAFAIPAIYLLASILINRVVGVLCAVLMVVPCLSVIVLLVVNQKATGYLQQHGVRVGFLGVNPRSI